jgi:hypothetical protein
MHRFALPWRGVAGCFVAGGALLLILMSLNGCTTVSGSSAATLVRVIDASQNAPALDAYVATVPIALNFVGPSVSNYAFLGPGTATVDVDTNSPHAVVQQLSGDFTAGAQHSIYITDQGTTYTATLLTDQSAAAPGGDVSFRFLQQANSTGAVDIYLVPSGSTLAATKPILSALAAGSVSSYLDVAANTYEIAVAPAGTTITTTSTNTNVYTSTATAFASGQVSTILIVDQQLVTAPPVTILVANDVD